MTVIGALVLVGVIWLCVKAFKAGQRWQKQRDKQSR